MQNINPVKKWLDTPFKDEFVKSRYEPSDILVPETDNIYRLEEFSLYYKDGGDQVDEDVKVSDTLMIDTLKHISDEEYKNSELFIDLYSRMEKYVNISNLEQDDPADEWTSVNNSKSNNNTSKLVKIELPLKYRNVDEINVLIPHNTNRYHANYLFKGLVNSCIDNDMRYSYYNFDNGNELKYNKLLVTPDFKSKFYEFCHKNT